MKRAIWLSSVLACLVPGLAFAQISAVPPNPLPPELPQAQAEQEGVETLTRGPIHEAFANPAEPDPEPNRIVPQQPPADVPEQPAEYRPEGDYEWIPGYWEWDDDRDEFVWVTGVWRQPPPNMRWVPGYWNQVEGGWQRVEGFWVSDEVENVTYYEESPPATIESGPSSPAPADNYFWIPGAWTYQTTGYVWQGGYWAPYQPSWVWVPTRWCWTPAGFVYLPGHWDYRMGDRGQIFAPVAFRTTVYTQPGYYYRPTVVIPTDNLFIYLWVRPRVGCYYFGNYFGPQYADRGFISWAHLGSHHHHHHRRYYDPFYSYAHVHYRRQGVDYLGRVQGWHRYYDEHPDHRPARTWREQHEHDRTHKVTGAAVSTQLTARTISEAARKGDTNFKLRRIDDRELQAQVQRTKKIRELDDARRKIERENAQVSATRTPRSRGPDDQRGRDQGKTGSLVDRVEKGDRAEKGDRGEKVDRSDKGARPEVADRGDKGDKGDKSDRPDRSEKGDRGDKGREAGSIVRDGKSPKLTLPKVERPGSGDAARTPGGQARDAGGQRGKAPPLPTATRRPAGQDERGPGAPRSTPGPDITRGSDRPPQGKRPGDTPDLTERRDDPPTVRRDTDRTPSFDPPGASGKGKSRGDTPKLPGADLPRPGRETPRLDQPPRPDDSPRPVQPSRSADPPRPQQPKRDADGPRLDQPPRPADQPRVQPRSNEIPRVQPPRPSGDQPRVESPGRSPDVPRVSPPNRGKDAPGSGDRGKSSPPTSPRSFSAPPKAETPRAAPRPEQPSVRNPQPQPRPQARSESPKPSADRSPGRSERSESSPPNSGSKGKGKDRDGKDN
jgi:hypothetical protein